MLTCVHYRRLVCKNKANILLSMILHSEIRRVCSYTVIQMFILTTLSTHVQKKYNYSCLPNNNPTFSHTTIFTHELKLDQYIVQ